MRRRRGTAAEKGSRLCHPEERSDEGISFSATSIRALRYQNSQRLPEMVKVARTFRTHWDGVLRSFTSRLNNGVLEGINSLIQAAKAKARG